MSAQTTNPPPDGTQLRRNLAIATLVVCPVLLLLPPRKLNLTSVALLSGTLASTHYLAREYSGTSFGARWAARLNSLAGSDLPPRAREIQEEMRQRREGAQKKDSSGLQSAWHAAEGPEWKKARDQREKEALEEGKGYGDLIMDQIWEVWSWGRKNGEEKADKGAEGRKGGERK